MNSKWLLLIVTLISTTACNLAAHGATTAAEQLSYVQEMREFSSALATTPVSTEAVDEPAAVPTVSPTARPIKCEPRPDWPIYIVVSRDTLTSIAHRTGSTVYELAIANCLADPNLIVSGSQLSVPQLPVPLDEYGS